MIKLYLKAAVSLVLLMVCMALLVLLPAWTIDYWQAWTFLAVYGASGVVIMAYLVARDPALMQRRMSGGPTAEKRTSQRIIMSIASLGWIAMIVVPGFDHRFGWSFVPAYVSIAADAVVVVGMAIVLRVFKENSFTSSTIEVAQDQRVVSSGPYAIVRHPMYSGFLLCVVAMPIALGSWWGLLPLLATMPVMVWRILDEEGLLTQDLSGYAEYTQHVTYRLVPHVW